MRVHVVTMCFAPARIVRQGVERFYATHSGSLPVTHYLVDQHYPVDRNSNREALLDLCYEHGLAYCDSGSDLGFHVGFNRLMERIKPEDDDIVITYDPDSWPLENGWDRVMVETTRDGGYKLLGLMNPTAEHELAARGSVDVLAGRAWVREITRQECVLGVTAWSVSFLRRVGWFTQPNAYYGGLETQMFIKGLNDGGNRWGYLRDYHEDTKKLCEQHDEAYHHWKREHAHTGTAPGSFADYLKAHSGS